MMMRGCLLLIFLVAYVQGYAIIGRSKLAVTASNLENGAAISLKWYSPDEEIPDNQNWVSDEQGFIRIKHYPEYVLSVQEFPPLPKLRDINTVTKINFAKWNIFQSEDKYYIQNVGNPLVSLLTLSIDGLFTFVDPFPTFDYIVVGAGTAGCKISKRLSDNPNVSVVTLEAGKRVDDDPLLHGIATIRAVEGTAKFNFQFYTERIANLGFIKAPAGVGKMWGGTSNHNGMLYTKGLKYDWALMEKFGGSQWNFDNYMSQIYRSQENYTGNTTNSYGVGGEISLVDSVYVPPVIEAPIVNATRSVYPTYGPFDLDNNPLSTFKLTQKNLGNNRYLRESSSTAYFNSKVVTSDGKGVGGRRLTVYSEVFANKLIFHPILTHRAIGVWYVDKEGKSQRVYADKEVILAAGVYNSPAILMRSGVGNCTELAALNITCKENNVYVGSNLQDHMRVQVEVTVPISNLLAVAANANALNTDGHLVEGVYKSPLAVNYTDMSVTNIVQPDTKLSILVASQIPYADLNTLFNLNWLETYTPPAIFEIAAILLRPKCTGKVSLVTSQPAVYPMIAADYLCHPDDAKWARETFKGIMSIVDNLNLTDPSYKAIFPSKEDINTEAKLTRWVKGLTTSYRHPAGTLRMAARDDVSKGVINKNLCVYGIQRVRVGDASIFPIIPSANLQASVYAIGGKVVSFAMDPLARCN